MKPRQALMVVGLAIAAWLAFFGDKTPSGKAVEPVERSSAKKAHPAAVSVTSATSTVTPEQTTAPAEATHAIAVSSQNTSQSSTGKIKIKPDPVILAVRPRAELISRTFSENGTANKSGGLFGTQSWVPPPPPPPKPAPPPPPSAPALPFTYIGKKLEDATWEVYLTRGESTFIVHEKTVIEATYRVDSIKPPTLTLTYLPLNQMQTLTIGSAE